ncbi:MAG: hypothetical protein RLZZ328_1509 [Bacteroidota bacterium]|jgi:hypothetical protein
MLTFRCMKCGNNLEFETADGAECNICGKGTMLVLVTEENKNSIPFPTDPAPGSRLDPSKKCQCAPGLCPCGKFVAHLVTEAWDPENPHLFGTEWDDWNKKKESEG